MYTVSKGPSKIVAKTRRGLTQNYEKFETIKESGKRSEKNSPENMHVPRPVFQAIKKTTVHTKQTEEENITPQHEEIIKYINDSWNILVAHNPYDITCSTNGTADCNNSSSSASCSTVSCISSSLSSSSTSSASSSACSSPAATPPPNAGSIYCVEPPSPVLSDFKPFDLESWWGRRLFNNITKSL